MKRITDKMRVDFWQRNPRAVQPYKKHWLSWGKKLTQGWLWYQSENLRQAIDAAIKAERKEKL